MSEFWHGTGRAVASAPSHPCRKQSAGQALRPASPYLDSGGVQHADRVTRHGQAGRADEVLIQVAQRGPVQGPARVLVRHVERVSSVPADVQTPASGEELLESRRAGHRVTDLAAERFARLPVAANIRSGPNDRMVRSPGRPPITSTDSVPLCLFTTWARNSHVAPRMDRPLTTTRSPARRPFHDSERSRCPEARIAAFRAPADPTRLSAVPLARSGTGARAGTPRPPRPARRSRRWHS